MFCPKDLRTNTFKNVLLPSNKSLFGRIPEKRTKDITVIEDDLPISMSKIESFQYYDAYDALQAENERNHENDSSSDPHEVERNEDSEES